MSANWQTAFVAVSIVIAEPLDEVARALGKRGDVGASALLRRLGAESREARARALSAIVSEVAIAVDEMRLA